MDKPLIKHGFVVIAVPEDGLFIDDNGSIKSGSGKEIKAINLHLFSRYEAAYRAQQRQEEKWKDGDVHKKEWKFTVLPVAVHERL